MKNCLFRQKPRFFENCLVIYPWGNEPAELEQHEFTGIASHQLNRFRLNGIKNSDRYVALSPMTFRSKRDFNTHRLLRAIDQNVLLSKLDPARQSREDTVFLTRTELLKNYEEFGDLVLRSEELLRECAIEFGFGPQAASQNLALYTQSREEDLELIRSLCEKGLKQRYDVITPEIEERIEKEIKVIAEKNYITYFLIAWDIITYAKSKGYYHAETSADRTPDRNGNPARCTS